MSINLIKKPNSLFGFFYRHWISIVLLVILATLIRQNFIINTFPVDIHDQQTVLAENIAINQKLKQDNLQLQLELDAKSDQKLEILESMARQKFGLIKAGEKYYQISISDQD
ncbi:MAG: septum formation initiator family protein [Proteobacteria bacterium]|nr:septum formation initiator family protein [Pseudomonadota bacterium]MCH9711322.1 septum formation initiator family protein [Pseudomonadota bacterium]MCH9749548.1 septum formation initiator family protein [Pseudomonadota bacterium]